MTQNWVSQVVKNYSLGGMYIVSKMEIWSQFNIENYR